MSEAATSNKNAVQPALWNNEGEGTRPGSSQAPDSSPAARGAEAVSENERSPSIQATKSFSNEPKPTFNYDEEIIGGEGAAPVVENSKSPPINAATTSSKGKSEQPTAVKSKQSDDAVDNLMALFHDFLQAASNPATATSNHTHTQRNTTWRKRLFGLNKGLSPETGSDNKYDYEQKYPRDRPGEEAGGNARVWLTYLDEAEAFDRERVEGWKDTVDVLLVFAGLFSGVITTFVSQASQSLQQDNTQVSASLLFEIAQVLRAQSSGTPINNIPNSTLTPASLFTPSPNAFLVNGLWFTSLAIALSTALFAVLAKQWLYYYITSISGTAHEKARARQLRFKGFELWKVGAIVDLLPILLHLALGIFLLGIIILLFPLDIRVAWTIVVITGITYFLYFISVILPIRYPECPYTTSLTIYIGVLVFFLDGILKWIRGTLDRRFQAIWGRINFKARHTIRRLLHYTQGLFRYGFIFIVGLVGLVRHGFRRFQAMIFTEESPKRKQSAKKSPKRKEELPKFTNWREENIKKAVKNAISLDFEALDWLYTTSPNRSVHRIIARCVAVHPIISQQFKRNILDGLWRTLEVSETNVVDLRYGLCLDLRDGYYYSRYIGLRHWPLLLSIPDVEESRLEADEYRSYSRIAESVVTDSNYEQILKDAVNEDLKFPLVMWRHLFTADSHASRASGVTVVVDILTDIGNYLFEWEPIACGNTGLVSFGERALRQWKFDYLFRHFVGRTPKPGTLDNTFEPRYLLLITIYRNLTSDQPLIPDKEQRQKSLSNLFDNFSDWLFSKEPRHVSSNQYLAFFIDICCVDAFWCEDMTDDGRKEVVWCLHWIWQYSIDIDAANQFPFTECDDLSPIYRWCSRDHLDRGLSLCTTPISILLFMPQNRDNLCTILSNDSDAVFHLSRCLRNLGNCHFDTTGRYLQSLMDLFISVDTNGSLFTVLYSSSVLVQLWKFLELQKTKLLSIITQPKLDPRRLQGLHDKLNKNFLSILQSRLDLQKLHDLHDSMIEEVQSEENTDDRSALEASAREFGQSIGVASQFQSRVENQSTEERDHDSEERAQPEGPNENENLIIHRMKRVFQSIWPKMSVKQTSVERQSLGLYAKEPSQVVSD